MFDLFTKYQLESLSCMCFKKGGVGFMYMGYAVRDRPFPFLHSILVKEGFDLRSLV